jgi:hypothetical protein
MCGADRSVSLQSADTPTCSFLNDIDLVHAYEGVRARSRANDGTAVHEDKRGGARGPKAGGVVRVNFKRWTPW